MRRYKRQVALAAVLVLALGAVSYAVAGAGKKQFNGALISYQEVPSVSSVGTATFEAQIVNESQIDWELSYSGLEGNVTQAHIHFGQRGVNGGIAPFLCSNLGNGPPGTQPCPPSPATISGTITAAEITGGASAQGIAAGELAEFLAAMRAGRTYANVHTDLRPGGEIRAQLGKEKD